MNPEDASRIQISVVVRAHNDAALIRDTLSMLTQQTVADRMEILFFDDNSTDGTLEIAKTFPTVTIVPWDGLPYNPPRVLNRALDTARGEFVVFNNSDAIPQSRDAVERLVAPLHDPAVGAVYGNQLPRPDAFPLVLFESKSRKSEMLNCRNAPRKTLRRWICAPRWMSRF